MSLEEGANIAVLRAFQYSHRFSMTCLTNPEFIQGWIVTLVQGKAQDWSKEQQPREGTRLKQRAAAIGRFLKHNFRWQSGSHPNSRLVDNAHHEGSILLIKHVFATCAADQLKGKHWQKELEQQKFWGENHGCSLLVDLLFMLCTAWKKSKFISLHFDTQFGCLCNCCSSSWGYCITMSSTSKEWHHGFCVLRKHIEHSNDELEKQLVLCKITSTALALSKDQYGYSRSLFL